MQAIMAHDAREKKAGTAAEHLPPVGDDDNDDEKGEK
jgi:hypothetical protein